MPTVINSSELKKTRQDGILREVLADRARLGVDALEVERIQIDAGARLSLPAVSDAERFLIADSFTIPAPPDQVWAFFLDVERMSQCVPGVEAVEAVDDKTYRGRLRVKVGPITARFAGTATLTQVDPPRRLAAAVEGDDKASASVVSAAFAATLTPVEGGTEVAYHVDVNLRGRLAQFGGPVIGATAKKLTAEFARNVSARLAAQTS